MPPVLEAVHTKAMSESIFAKSEDLYNVKNYTDKSKLILKTIYKWVHAKRNIKTFMYEKRHYFF